MKTGRYYSAEGCGYWRAYDESDVFRLLSYMKYHSMEIPVRRRTVRRDEDDRGRILDRNARPGDSRIGGAFIRTRRTYRDAYPGDRANRIACIPVMFPLAEPAMLLYADRGKRMDS